MKTTFTGRVWPMRQERREDVSAAIVPCLSINPTGKQDSNTSPGPAPGLTTASLSIQPTIKFQEPPTAVTLTARPPQPPVAGSYRAPLSRGWARVPSRSP